MIIEHCDTNPKNIELFIDGKFMEIDREELFAFVQANDLDAWVDDFPSPYFPDGHGQITGRFSEDEYFSLPFEKIKNDILQFLNKNKNDDTTEDSK